ncbi:MAG: alpha-galactosidase [Clostridia bacterium]|nr:alpha-galactosidase [Clostridia bacterium]
MKLEPIEGCAASFLYDGERVELDPASMRKTGPGVFEKTMEDGLTAVLEIGETAPDAVMQLLRFENRGAGKSGTISAVRSLDALFPAGGEAAFESLTGDDCGACSYNPRREILSPGKRFAAEPRFGRPADTFAFPFFDLITERGAATFGVGWSGQWRLEIEKNGETVRVAAGLPDVETFLLPGEKIRTARILYLSSGDVGASRRAFRRLMLEKFSPRETGTGAYIKLPVALQNFDRYFRKNPLWDTVEGQRRCADAAAACGMDTLWLDAAWFREGFPGGVGNDEYAPGFPNGTGEVSARAHEKGLRYVQWFEPERANAYSDTLRYHFDDVIVLKGNESVNNLVNIGEERVRRRVTDMLKRHIREDGIDVYREDFNICPSGYWRTADRPGRRGMTEIRFVEGLYAMWDELLREFPGLLIDNCSSGGRRIDLETCRRAVPLWRSDTGCSSETAEKRVAEWSQNQILGLTRYLPYHSCASYDSSAYAMRSTASGGVACNFDVLSPDFDPQDVRPAVEEVKRLRPYWYGDFYPLTEQSLDEDVWIGWQLSLGDRGAAWFFRRKDCPEESFRPALAAIDPEARYRVILTDEAFEKTEEILSGKELAGIRLTCPLRRSSVVLEYEKIERSE